LTQHCKQFSQGKSGVSLLSNPIYGTDSEFNAEQNSAAPLTSFPPAQPKVALVVPKAFWRVVGDREVPPPPVHAASRVYDADVDATITSRTLTGVLNGDDVSYVGNGKTATATGLSLSGADADNLPPALAAWGLERGTARPSVFPERNDDLCAHQR
jgi:hypothetical protein